MRIDNLFGITADIVLVGGHDRLFNRPRSERRAFHGPAFISILAPILERNIRLTGDLFLSFFNRTGKHAAALLANDRVAPFSVRQPVIQANCILKPAKQLGFNSIARRIFHGETHYRRRQTRVVDGKRDEG